jgi:hypothetical protein
MRPTLPQEKNNANLCLNNNLNILKSSFSIARPNIDRFGLLWTDFAWSFIQKIIMLIFLIIFPNSLDQYLTKFQLKYAKEYITDTGIPPQIDHSKKSFSPIFCMI